MEFKRMLEADKDAMIASLQRCISFRSVQEEDDSGYPYGQGVQDCLEYMVALSKELGFASVNMDNQAGWCEYGTGEEMIAVLGHLDVVPEGDGWTVPPYGGVIKDGRIYGRGTTDDKGPIVAAMYALKALRDSGVSLKRRIRILFGTNEETGSADMKYYIEHGGEVPVMGFTPDAQYPVINGEKGLITSAFTKPLKQTGGIRLVKLEGGTAHNIVPGIAWAELACPADAADEICARQVEKVRFLRTASGVRVEAEGVSAHGGLPWLGENAIGRLMLALKQLPLEGDFRVAVDFLADKIGMEYNGESMGIALKDEPSGELTLNLGVAVSDGDSITVKLNYRYPVTYTFDDCAPILEKQFADAGFKRTSHSHKKALYMAPDSPLVAKLTDVYVRCTGLDGTPICIGGGTYAKMIPNTLAFGTIFPGDESREHQPDEFIEIDRLMQNAWIIAEAMYELAK